MTNFLPYAIIAGIVIVFFVVCYVLYSGGNHDEEIKNEKKIYEKREETMPRRRMPAHRAKAPKRTVRQQKYVKEDTSPLPKISTVTVRERQEHPDETAFVTTKGEAVRRNGRIVYQAAKRPAPKDERENLDITRVLSRDEILAAMDKVDKEEAAAYKAKSEEAKKERERQAAEEKAVEAKHIAEDQAMRARSHREQAMRQQEETKRQKQAQWADEVAKTEAEEPQLADMAAVVAADLASQHGTNPETVQKQGRTTAAANGLQAAAAPPVAPQPEQETSQPVTAHRKHILQAVMAENAKAAGQPLPVNSAVPQPESEMPQTSDSALNDETQIIDPAMLRQKEREAAARKKAQMAAVAASLGQTQRMEPIHIDTAAPKNSAVAEETAIMPPVHSRQTTRRPQASAPQPDIEIPLTQKSPWGNDLSATKATPLTGAGKRQSIWNEEETQEEPSVSPLIQRCAEHFLNQFGMITPALKKQAEYITAAAFQRIGCTNDEQRQQAMSTLLAQEALLNLQKAYAAHPESHVEALALQAFDDIVQGSPVSTRHLVAIDALKVMPYLSNEHYKILAVLLLFLYSRNSHNVDKETFSEYIDKYVAPFLDGFPTERPYYQQLDYLRCTAFESKETHFAEILSDSYPLLFRYRGFTEEELRKALRGKRMPAEFIVQSFNSPLIKLAMVDESMTTRFFRMTGIQDRMLQEQIMRLAKKRPASFNGEEALDIMEDISPLLADLGDIWDSTMLRISTLSLLGLYLAQGYVKERIGEEFDLSRWFE